MAKVESLNLSLTRERAEYVGDRVRSGRYCSASEVVRTALRLLQREEAGSGCAAHSQELLAPPAPTSHG